MFLFSFVLPAMALVMAIVALNKITSLSGQIARLKMELAVLAQKLEQGVAPAPASKKTKALAEPAAEYLSKVSETVAADPEPAPAVAAPEPVSSPVKVKPARDMEQALASRWFVWIGGIAIAIGGLLFIKYAYDVGLISPTLQIILGLLAGGGLIFAGHSLREKSPPIEAPDKEQNYVPAALSAAGLVTCFGAIYAAYALYDLVNPMLAFVGLGLVALGAFYLSRFQGPLIAALGLVGSLATPLLIPSSNPNAWGFFPYLLIVATAAFFTLRERKWWWLGYAALAGTFVWSLLWLHGGPFELADVAPIGLFAIALAAVASIVPSGRSVFQAEAGSLLNPKDMSQPLLLATAGMAAAGIVLTSLVVQSGHTTLALVFFVIGMAAVASFGWLKQGWSLAPLLAAAVTWLAFMAWPDVAFHEYAFDERGFWTTVPGQVTPAVFRNWMLLGLAGFTGLGLFGLWRRSPPQIWAGLAAGSAFLFLFGIWARADFLLGYVAWAVAGFALAALLLAAIWQRRASLTDAEQNTASGILLVGATLLILFGLDRLFDGIAYTMSIAALATAIAYGTKPLLIRMAGRIASIVGAFAAIRLFAAREFWEAESGLLFGDHWPIYGYGIPVVLFWLASRVLKSTGHPRPAMAFEGMSLALAISLVSLELRVLIGGSVTSDEPKLLEAAAHILAWLGAAFGLAYRQNVYSSFVSLWGARILLAASCAGLILVSLLAYNPVVTNHLLQGTGMFNSLLLAYLAPVPLLALMARKLEGLGWGKLRNALGILALVLLFTYVTLETKRNFQGSRLIIEAISDAEYYAYSAVWLALAVALFVGGIKLARQNIRYGGMAVMVLVVLKVFLSDMSDLDGLYRIVSFVGLGLCLVGMGWLYTRYVQPPKDAIPS